MAIDSLLVRATEGLLRAYEVPAEELALLQREWQRHAQLQTMKWALLGERAGFIRMTDKERAIANVEAILAANPVQPRRRRRIPNPVDWIPFKDDWFMFENRVRGVTVLNRLITGSDSCVDLLATARREQTPVPRFAPGPTLIRTMLPSITRAFELHTRSLAFFRCVPVALAAERFRLETGRFPADAGELVPEYLATVPGDPFDAKPIRLVTTDDGIAAYSVGENLSDDGGLVVPQGDERFGQDFGFRLYRVEKRGLVFLDNPCVETGQTLRTPEVAEPDSHTRPGPESRADARQSVDIKRFRAKVVSVSPLRSFHVDRVKPTCWDGSFLLTLRVVECRQGSGCEPGQMLQYAIHSPARFFRTGEDVGGEEFTFREAPPREGVVRFAGQTKRFVRTNVYPLTLATDEE